MDIIERINNILENKQYDIAENLCISSLLRLNKIEECASILADIYVRTSNLNFLNNPTQNMEFQHLLSSTIDRVLEMSNECAISLCKKTLQLNLNDPEISQKIAGIYLDLGFENIRSNSIDQAQEYFKLAFEIDFNKLVAVNKLLNFCRYDHWIHKKDIKKALEILTPYLKLWDCSSKKKTVLVYSTVFNEGFGDNILNIRVLNHLKHYFEEIKVLCRPELKELFENSFCDININFVDFSDKIWNINEDCECCAIAEIMTHAKLYKLQSVPSKYLKTKPEKVESFKNKYFEVNKPKVGICWQGNIYSWWDESINRSMHIDILKDLFNLDNIQFYSLQKGNNNEIEKYPQVINLATEFHNFDDTLAAMLNLNLVITVDTSILHLAGAAGIKTFLMLPLSISSIWKNTKNKTPLYDSVEIFWQKELGNWDNVIQQIKEKLLEMYEL